MPFRSSTAAAISVALLAAGCGSNSTPVTPKTTGPAPDIASVNPSRSPLDGGGFVVVRGLGFAAGATVTVGGVPGKSVVVVDRETLSFQVPSGRPGPADLIVQNTDGGKRTFAQGITYEAPGSQPPQLGHVTPNSGPSGGGTYAKLEGQGFADGAILLVAGAPASLVTVLSPALLTARLPGHTGTGTGDVVITNPDGQSATLFGGFAYAATLPDRPPKVTSVEPSEGPLEGGNHAIISAEGVGPNALLFIGGQPATFAAAAGGVNALLPAGRHHGLADVAITNSDGQSDLLPGAYNYFLTHLTVPPALARITPNRSPLAGGGTVVIEGEGFAPGAHVLFGATAATAVTVAGPRVLTCVVPPGAAPGAVDVTLQNEDGGSAVVRGAFVYAATNLPAPTVTAVAPNNGPATGGTVAEVNGTGFIDGALVIVGGRPASSVVLVDPNTVTGRFPALPAGAADVTVTNPDGQSGTLRASFTVAASVNGEGPRVNAITPAAGPLEGGQAAIITGNEFSPGARVFIGGRPAAAALQGGSALAVIIPPGAGPGLADVAVTNSDGQSDVLPGGFNYFTAPPVLTGISPTCGPVGGGTTVVISGRSLRNGVSATVGGQPLTGLQRLDSGTLQGGTSRSPSAGPADVAVTNLDGQADVISGGFFFTDSTHPCQATTTATLTLKRVAPGSGPTTGHVVITLIGEGFVSGATVKFGDLAATEINLLGSGALTASLPAGTRVGPVDVTLTLADGRSSKLAGAFNYFDPNSNRPAPVVSAIAPNAGPNTGNSVVQITGASFALGARVFFGAVEAALPTLVDGNRLVAVTPSQVSGPVDVTVINDDGKSGSLAFGFAYYPFGAAGSPPSAQRLEPRTGSTITATGAVVFGSGFAPGALVFVGGVPASSVHLQPDGSLAVNIDPQAPGTVDVIVTNPDGQSSTINQGFTFAPPTPHLTALSPAFGPLAGGTTVVVSGSGLLAGDLIKFGGALAAVKVLDDTAIFATVPAHDAGIVDVTLVRTGATVDTLPASFTYDPNYQQSAPPAIASLEPSTGPLSGGTVLWLTGSSIATGARIFFGANQAARIVRADSGHAVVTVPPGAAAGFVDVNIVNPDGKAGALLRGFSYVADALLSGLPPKLTSVTPDKGPESTDTIAILTGRNFVAGELVFVGGARGAGVRLLSSSILSTTFPHQPAGPVDVAVTHPDGRSSVMPGAFTFLARPSLVSVGNTNNPGAGASGPTVGGTGVTIAGTGFQQGATITFGNAAASGVVWRSDTIITCNTPPGAAGAADVQLINPDGQAAVLQGGWLFVSPPKATGLTPPTGPVTGGTYAVLAGTDFSPLAVVTVGGVQATTVFGSSTSLVVLTAAGQSAGPVDLVVRNPDGQTSTLVGGFTYSVGPFGAAPTIASISPSTGPDSGNTFVAINGSNYRTGSIGIVGGNLLGRNLVVGPGAMTGLTGPGIPGKALVAVTNADGVSATLGSGFLYSDHTTLGPPPVVDRAVPGAALAPGGSAVAVLGGGFSTLTPPLVFMQGIPTSLSAGNTGNQLNVITPAAQPGPADIAVVNPDGQTSIKINAFNFLVPPPVFASTNPLSPVKGPTLGGTAVTITGSYFQPPLQVFFGNSPGTVNTDPAKTNANQITVTTPPGVAGFVAVLVQNKDGQSASLPGAFYFQPPPVLTQVSPTSGGPDGGYSVSLRGQFFSGDANTIKVKFGAANAPIKIGTVPSSSVIEVIVPASGSTGGSLTVAVSVTNDDGQSVTSPGAFIYLPPPAPPQLLGITPNSSQQVGGITTTVLGQHFQFGALVFFGDSSCLTDPTCTCPSSRCLQSSSVNVTSDSALSCLVPAASGSTFPKTVFVRVRNPDDNEATLAGAFTYVSGPAPSLLKILNLAPNTGVTTGGTVVFIGGTGFQVGAIASLLPHDGTACPSGCDLLNVQVLGPTAIQATIPAQPTGATLYDLVVRNPGGGSGDQLPSAWTYGGGTRRFIATGSRMPLEMHNNKFSRGLGGRTTPAWTGTVNSFTRTQAGRADVFLGGWSGRNPRLYQGQCESNDTDCGPKTRRFVDFTQNLRNPDGTPVKDQCCGSTNSQNRSYFSFLPRSFDLDGNGLPEAIFWNDASFGLSIFWNSNNILTAREYTAGVPTNPTDWFGGFDPASGAMIDFNLDGAADFAFVADGYAWLMLNCGGSRPDPLGGNVPVPAPAGIGCIMASTPPSANKVVTVPSVTPQTPVSVTFLNTETASFSSTNFALFMPVGSRWIADVGQNSEIVTITASTSTSFTANFYNSHGSGFQLAPVISTTARTNVVNAGTQTQVVVDDISGFASTNIVLVADYGTSQEERVQVYPQAIDYPNRKVTFTFGKTHTQPFALSVRDGHTLLTDSLRFSEVGSSYTVVAGDVAQKGHTDVIVGNENAGLKLFFNNALDLKTRGKDPMGFGLTTSPTVMSSSFPGGVTGGNVRALALVDLNGDTLPDLLVGYRDNQHEKLFINRGNGVFVDEAGGVFPSGSCTNPQQSGRLPPSIGDSIVRYDVRDIDGSGKPDVLAWVEVKNVTNTFPKPLRYWLNDGKGCFAGEGDWSNGGAADQLFRPDLGILQTWQYAFGDYNGDGFPDMIAALDQVQSREYVNYNGSMLDKTVNNLPDSTSTADPAQTANVWWHYTTSGLLLDANNDGFPDLITSQFNTNPFQCGSTQRVCDPDGAIHLYLNDGQGNFPHDDSLDWLPTGLVAGKRVSALPIGSWAMDAAPLSNAPNAPIGLIIASATSYSVPHPPVLQGTALDNATGAHRLLVSTNHQPFIDQTYPSLPTGGEIFTVASSVKFADLDQDGYQDIIIGDSFSGQVQVWKGTPGGYFIDVTSTAIPGGMQSGGSFNRVTQILAGNIDGDNFNLPDLFIAREGNGSRLLINHSDPVAHTIRLVDETTIYAGQPLQRLPNPPNVASAVLGHFACNGTSLDLYAIDTAGGEHLYTNGDCPGANCGFFQDNSAFMLPNSSKGSSCIGTDCAGNVHALGIKYSGNDDIFISRQSDNGTLRPHRLLRNDCGKFTDITLQAWSPIPIVDDKIAIGFGSFSPGAISGDIFGHQAAGDGNGTVQDLVIFNLYGPRIYRNSP